MWRDKVDILKRDDRFFILQQDDPALGAISPLVIEDLYDDIAHLGLPASVPKDIAHQFDLARNAYLYSWFEYEMATLAEAHSYTVVEMAIKRRIKDSRSLWRKAKATGPSGGDQPCWQERLAKDSRV